MITHPQQLSEVRVEERHDGEPKNFVKERQWINKFINIYIVTCSAIIMFGIIISECISPAGEACIINSKHNNYVFVSIIFMSFILLMKHVILMVCNSSKLHVFKR